MFKIGDRIEVVAGVQRLYKGVITHLYPETMRVMVWLDTDREGVFIGMAMAFDEVQIIKEEVL